MFVGHFCPPGYGSKDPIETGSDPDTDPLHALPVTVPLQLFELPYALNVCCSP